MGDQSIWKKEIHLRKRTGEPVQATPSPRFEEKKDSIWHRELSFRKSDKTVVAPPAEAVPVSASAPEPMADEVYPTVAVTPTHEAVIQPAEPAAPTYESAAPTYEPAAPNYQPVEPTYQPAAPTYRPLESRPAAETYSSPAEVSLPQVPARAEEPPFESTFGAPAPMWDGHAAELPSRPPVTEPSAAHPVPELERPFVEGPPSPAVLPPWAVPSDPEFASEEFASEDTTEPTVPHTFGPADDRHFEETYAEPASQSPHPYNDLPGTTYQRVDFEPRDFQETWTGAVEQSPVPVPELESPAPAANHLDEPFVSDDDMTYAHSEPEYGTPAELPLTSFVSESPELWEPEPESYSDAPLPSQPAPTWGLGEPYEAAAPVVGVGAGGPVDEDVDAEASQDPPADPSVTTWAFDAPVDESDAFEPAAETLAEPHVPTAYTHPMTAPDDEPADHVEALAATVVAAAVADETIDAPKKKKKKEKGEKKGMKREVSFPSRKGKSKEKSGEKSKGGAAAGLAAGAEKHAIKNVVGLRIGSSQLAAAYVHNNGSAELVQLARTPLTRGIVSGGEVRDPEALTRALKSFFTENKLPRRGVRLGIASNRIGVRVLEVPAVDDKKLFENSIRFHAQETLPIAVGDAIIDHVALGEGADESGEPTVRVLLVFAHRELVDSHVEACRRAGLKLDGVDLEAFALLRALAVPRAEETEATSAVVAVAVGQERTIFAVSDGRVCDFTRVLEWGGGAIDVAIARALDLTPSQAEPIKHQLSLDGDTSPSGLDPEKANAAQAAARNELQVLSRELVASLQFYQARAGSLDISEILLSGGGAELEGFAPELEQLIGVPVRVGDPFSRVVMGRKVTRPDGVGSLAVAIGLGIED